VHDKVLGAKLAEYKKIAVIDGVDPIRLCDCHECTLSLLDSGKA
jgi:hypothetical protein